jgi:predicted metal-dependent enzyme (double-stranded beta helix superfamily)
MTRFDADRFVDACLTAAADADPMYAVREVVLQAISDPDALETAFPLPIVDPDDDGVLFRSTDLLVACPIFPRQFSTGIHNHQVPAVIGVWSGYEDNHLFEQGDVGLRSLGVTRVNAGEVLVLDADAIHDVSTPDTTHSAALHVYLGDITSFQRSLWDDPAGDPLPYDGEEQERRWTEAALATGLFVRPSDQPTRS